MASWLVGNMIVASTDTDELLDRAKLGDRSAQQQLLVKHQDKLKRMIASLLDPRLAPRIDASDVLQDTLAKATRNLPKYLQHQTVAFYPWLRQIAKERLIDVHRRHLQAQRRSVTKENQFDVHVSDASAQHLARRLVSRETSPSNLANQHEMSQRIKAAMALLPAAGRELLLMGFVEQLSNREIAEVLSVSEVTARSRMRRAIERLSSLIFDGKNKDDL